MFSIIMQNDTINDTLNDTLNATVNFGIKKANDTVTDCNLLKKEA